MQFLVVGSAGPGFSSKSEAEQLLGSLVLPSFKLLRKLEAEKKIIAGGVPVAEREIVFIAEASSNSEMEDIVRSLPIWGILTWKVTPLISFAEREKADSKAI